jgi:Lipocalin-like domain
MKRDDHGHRGSTGLATRFARRLAAAILIVALVGTAGVAPAGGNLLAGAWKLKSFVREDVASGERKPALGKDPEGYLGYGLDGRMYALFVAGVPVVPAGDQPTDWERAQLHKSMVAYGGTYTIAGDKGHPSHRYCMEQRAPRIRPGPVLQARRREADPHD